MKRTERSLAKAERARKRADRRSGRIKLARRAERIEAYAPSPKPSVQEINARRNNALTRFK